jgi:hypothetical protein
MTPEETVLDYYEALRRGEPLYPYFVEREATWKAAISTEYSGYDAVSEALREQSRATDEWTVESGALSVTEREGMALFDDAVRLAWTDTRTGERHGFDSRWSGALEPLDGDDEEWGFVQMHVSAPRSI